MSPPRRSRPYPRRVACALCGTWLNAAKVAGHMARVHPDGHVSEHHRQALLTRRLKARRAAAARAFRVALPAVAVVALLLLGYWWFALHESPPEAAYPWRLDDTEGRAYDSDDYYDEGLVLVEFMHTKCGYCQEMASVLNEVYANYSDDLKGMFSIGGYTLGGSVDDVDTLHQFKIDHESEWPHLYDQQATLMQKYPSQGFPTIVLVKDGRIVYNHSGAVSYDRLAAEIEKRL